MSVISQFPRSITEKFVIQEINHIVLEQNAVQVLA